ncbi:hypothetical protein [uncultured Desulfuromusa sp.]|uniref:hypothetical protein n=1 Tax=uncultured Desulfuromusa sp. TaxID=219183 RepID=UPI002AA92409|nr:hypothetical protein [uncultured Desulfuromusa sp.]
MDSIIKLCHELHQNPELSGRETETSDQIVRFFESPVEIIENLALFSSTTAPAGEITFITVVGARLGEKDFGTAPGQTEI